MGGFSLERWKFGIYVIAPILAVYFFSMPAVHEAAIKSRRYIVYQPGRGVRPIKVDDGEADIDEAASRLK